MDKNKKLKNLKYDIFLFPASSHFSLDDSVGNISKLNFKRGLSYFDFKIFYKDNEFYRIKYNFKDKNYQKSYLFREGDKIINKKNIQVNKQQDIQELNSFLVEHFYKIIENHYKLSKDSDIGFDSLTEDLMEILRFIS